MRYEKKYILSDLEATIKKLEETKQDLELMKKWITTGKMDI